MDQGAAPVAGLGEVDPLAGMVGQGEVGQGLAGFEAGGKGRAGPSERHSWGYGGGVHFLFRIPLAERPEYSSMRI